MNHRHFEHGQAEACELLQRGNISWTMPNNLNQVKGSQGLESCEFELLPPPHMAECMPDQDAEVLPCVE
jgi:hypothetical protein